MELQSLRDNLQSVRAAIEAGQANPAKVQRATVCALIALVDYLIEKDDPIMATMMAASRNVKRKN